MLRALRNVNIVGADIVEVAPAYDHAQITAVAASHVAYEIISAMTPATQPLQPENNAQLKGQ
jgi:agmatinase